MPVGVPTTGTQIHLHIAAPRRLFTELKDGPAEFGTSFQILKTRVKHPNVFPVQVCRWSRRSVVGPKQPEASAREDVRVVLQMGMAPERTRASAYQLSANEYTLTLIEIEMRKFTNEIVKLIQRCSQSRRGGGLRRSLSRRQCGIEVKAAISAERCPVVLPWRHRVLKCRPFFIAPTPCL